MTVYQTDRAYHPLLVQGHANKDNQQAYGQSQSCEKAMPTMSDFAFYKIDNNPLSI